MKLVVTGTDRVRATLLALASQLPVVVGGSLYEEAETMMGEAKIRTPVDTGALRASGYVGLPEYQGRQISVELGFGGGSVTYAVHVHEDLNMRHKVGQAKFLESVLVEQGPDLVDRLVRRVGQRTGMA